MTRPKLNTLLFGLAAVALVIGLIPSAAFAQTTTVDGVTLTAPDNQRGCPPDGAIRIEGVLDGLTVNFDYYDVTTKPAVHLGGGSIIAPGGPIDLTFPYPSDPADLDGHIFAVFISTLGASGSPVTIDAKWRVKCPEATSTPTSTDVPPTDTPTPTDTATPTATEPGPTPTDTATATATATSPTAQGCTPGFWRQDQHFDSWTGYSPGDDFEAVFGVDASFDPHTLLDAVWLEGGGEEALARHAVAALLNATSPDVDYAYSAAEVIAMVQSAYSSGDFEGIKDLFEAANEIGCPLD
jgi:hypothetical protein